MRRAAVASAILLLAALGGGTPYAAAQTSPPPPWTGGWDAARWSIADTSSHPLTGVLRHLGYEEVTVTITVTGADMPRGCAVPPGATSTGGVVEQPHGTEPLRRANYFSLGFLAECNGSYVVEAVGSVTLGCGTPDTPCASDPVQATVAVARPAPPVSGVSARSMPDRTVKLTWDPIATTAASPSPPPKDMTGFVVTRSDGVATKSFVVADPAATTFTDSSMPTSGGTFTYQVASTRYNVEPSSPSAAVPVGIAAAPSGATTTTTTPPASVPAPPAAGAEGGGAEAGRSSVVPTRNPGASRNPGAPLTTPSGFDAEGFSSALPYEAEPGGVAARLPSGNGGGGLNVAGAGLLVPFAVALLLALWGLHILFVTKAAREADQALALLHLELE